MTQKIYKDGTDQYVLVRLGGIDSTTGAQSLILGGSGGVNLSDTISTIVIAWSEYKKEDDSLPPVVTWNSAAGMWKIAIPAGKITQCGSAWINLSGQDVSGLMIIPVAIEVSVASTPDYSQEIIEGTLTRIEVERLIAAVLCGDETRTTGSSTFIGLDGSTPRVVASLSLAGRNVTSLDGGE